MFNEMNTVDFVKTMEGKLLVPTPERLRRIYDGLVHVSKLCN